MEKKNKVFSNESINVKNMIIYTFNQIKDWFKRGNPPPKTQVKSLYLMVFLLIIGIIFATISICSRMDIGFQGVFKQDAPVGFVAFLTLCPSLYGLYISYHCWRNHHGYDWFMVPNF